MSQPDDQVGGRNVQVQRLLLLLPWVPAGIATQPTSVWGLVQTWPASQNRQRISTGLAAHMTPSGRPPRAPSRCKLYLVVSCGTLIFV